MNAQFLQHVERIPLLYTMLIAQKAVPVRCHGLGKLAGIYIFYQGGEPVHVGRTRNVRQRLRAHCTPNHNSASFAFKQARRELGQVTTYNRITSRAALQADDVFGACFRRHVTSVREMFVRFISVSDPIDQYLLELYAALELGLATDEFDTH